MRQQSIAANSATALVGRAVHVALGITITAAVTRLLGVSAFGTYAALLAVCSLLVVAADFGLYLSFTRAIGENSQRTAELLSDISWLRLVLLLSVFTLGSFLIRFLPAVAGLTPVFWVAALGFVAQSFSQLFMGVFQAHAAVWRATVGDLGGRVIQLAVILGLASLAASPSSHSLTAMVSAASLGALVSYAIHRLLLPFAWRLGSAPSWNRSQTILRDAFPLATLLILNVVYFRVDMVILSYFRAVSEVGLYGLAYRIIESALFIPAMFGGLLLPRLSNPKNPASSLLTESIHALLWAGTGLSLILALLAAPGIQFLSGGEYVAAAPLLQTLSLALAIMFLGNLFGFTLVARKQQRSLLKLYLTLVVGNVLLNLWLVPAYGATAAAWVTVATEAAATATAAFWTWKIIPFSVSLSYIVRLAAVLALTAASIQMMPSSWHVIIQGSVSGLIFLFSSLLFRVMTRRQFHSLITQP